jgi:two-component sensor histidine kinase
VSLIVTCTGWLNLTIQTWLFGGVRDASFAAYILMILVANLLLGWQMGAIFLLLSIVAGLGVAHAEAIGILPFMPDDPYELWIDHSLNFVLATIIVSMISNGLKIALARTRSNERSLAERNRQLQASEEKYRKLNQELETRVLERTGELTQVNADLAREIVERKQVEEQVKLALREKEVLLQEIHHRVKNNLQIISSLLSLQSQAVKDNQLLDILRNSQNRLRSIALIHEKLYRSHNLARVDLAEYLQELVVSLFRAYSSGRDITFKVQADSVLCGIDTAVPAGLIVNELVTNSLKHAFPEGQAGVVCLELSIDSNHSQVTLKVGDNGTGFPAGVDLHHTTSLGLQLVIMLVDQLDGTIEFDNQSGAEFKITLPLGGEP